jgi:photosystem II stability/assembly factor-like uncharacterized protein
MSDSLERFLEEMQFEVPVGLIERARKAVALEDRTAPNRIVEHVEDPDLPNRRTREAPRSRLEEKVGSPRGMALVAALLVVAIVAGLVLAAHALHTTPPVPANKARLVTGAAAESVFGGATWFFSANDAALEGRDAAGTYSVIVTHDGGRTWLTTPLIRDLYARQRPGEPQSPFVSLKWLDSQHIVAFLSSFTGRQDTNLIEATDDGGQSWHSTNVNVAMVANGSTFFLDAHEGWTVLSDNTLYHTVDSGAHWEQLPRIGVPATQAIPLYPLSFEDSEHGFVGTADSDGVGRLFATLDGGRSWQLVQLPAPPGGWQAPMETTCPPEWATCDRSSICTAPTDVALPTMFGQDGVVLVEQCQAGRMFAYRTTDGGLKWGNAVELPFLAPTLSPVQFFGRQDWLKPDGLGGFYRSRDSGLTWVHTHARLPNGYTLASVLPVGGQTLWGTAINGECCGAGYAVRSIDNGSTWSLLQIPAGLGWVSLA